MSRIESILETCKARGQGSLVGSVAKVAVHDGKFHLDELVAIVLVKILADKMGVTLNITRTRDPKILASQDIVLDVGCLNEGKYFDHHQRDFNKKHVLGHFEYTYASAGLVWEDIGLKILELSYHFGPSYEPIQNTYDQVEKKLIVPVDALDNGEWKYRINGPMPMMLPDIVNNFNELDPTLQEDGFYKALNMVELIFTRRIILFCRSSVAIAQIGEEMRLQSQNPNEHIFVMQEPGPWLSALQCNWELCAQFALCIYPANLKKDLWNIQTFPLDKDLRQSQRCPAPEAWRGWSKMYQNTSQFPPEIALLMNQYGCTFIHVKGFIGAVRGTLNTAKEFAKQWLMYAKKERNDEVLRIVA